MQKHPIFPFLWMRGEEETAIRAEMEKIYRCGIRGVCVEARPHPDYCGPGWWHDLDIVLDEAEKRGMEVWILDDKHFPTGYANGMIEKHPEHRKWFLNYNVCPLFGSCPEVTVPISDMLAPARGFADLGKKFDREEQANNQLVAVVAVQTAPDKKILEDTLWDVTDRVKDGWLTLRLPGGQWKLYVIFKTRTDGGYQSYVNFMDFDSTHLQIEGVYEPHYARYQEKFGSVIKGFFSDEPPIGNLDLYEPGCVVGEKDMPMPWSDELSSLLRQDYGAEFRKMLVYLWASSVEMRRCPKVRYQFMNHVSRLYEKNFSRQLGDWCRAHGVEYIGHIVEDFNGHSRLGSGIAHYFRAMAGQDMAGIDAITDQIVLGAPDLCRWNGITEDPEFFFYAMGKMGSSCGHLDPLKKGRTMCELYGASGWKTGMRDMRYLLDHLLVQGVNRLVPHAFSMAAYPDPDCPPHFYAQGNNPLYPYFSKLMQYAGRMCSLLSEGRHVAKVALLYDGEADWCGPRMLMQKPARALTQNQIDFDIVPLDMLLAPEAYGGSIDSTICLNNEEFSCLVIPYLSRIPSELVAFLAEHPALPAFFVDALPESPLEGTDKSQWELLCVTRPAIPLSRLGASLRSQGFFEVEAHGDCTSLAYYHYQKDQDLYFLLNQSSDSAVCCALTLPGEKPLWIYDAMEDTFAPVSLSVGNGRRTLALDLAPGHSLLLLESPPASARPAPSPLPESWPVHAVLTGWQVSKARAIDYPAFDTPVPMEVLKPISHTHPTFSGIIRYEKTLSLPHSFSAARLTLEEVYDSVRLWVNGEDAGMQMLPPFSFDLTGLLRQGENTLRIEVSTTLEREQALFPQSGYSMGFSYQKPTGLAGAVVLETDSVF